jgi:hypothetical protein
MALNPHWASLNPVCSVALRITLYAREMISRFGPRTTRAPGASLEPMATSE